MSFSFNFVATQADALEIVKQEHAPEIVREYIRQGLSAFKPEELVSVKAIGHLYNKDYETTTAEIMVARVTTRKPRVEA